MSARATELLIRIEVYTKAADDCEMSDESRVERGVPEETMLAAMLAVFTSLLNHQDRTLLSRANAVMVRYAADRERAITERKKRGDR